MKETLFTQSLKQNLLSDTALSLHENHTGAIMINITSEYKHGSPISVVYEQPT